METKLTWDEKKRQSNLEKHGLDFADAGCVLDSPYRLDIPTERNKEARTASFAYVFERLAVLTVAHVARDGTARVISFRPASGDEREAYHEWLESE
jgi:uncharacterized DUF497 family protein